MTSFSLVGLLLFLPATVLAADGPASVEQQQAVQQGWVTGHGITGQVDPGQAQGASMPSQSVYSEHGSNRAGTAQTGAGNQAETVQTGNGNTAVINQRGQGNASSITQRGAGHAAENDQTGGAAFNLDQSGPPGSIVVRQNGGK